MKRVKIASAWKSERIVTYGCLLLAAVALTVLEGDMLHRIQEQNLFLHTPLFFRQCMVSAGGLLTWMGAYLTQFLYYPALGAGILCLLWALLVWMTGRTFGLARQWMPLTLLPVACLLIADTDLGYWIYYLKLRGHFFDATLGTMAAVGLTWAYRSLPRKAFLRSAFIPLSTLLGYVLFGFYGLWATVLMGITAWRTDSRRVTYSLLTVTSVVAVPLLCYEWLFHETNLVNIYWVGLPVFALRQETYFAYNIPYILLVVSIMAMACCGGVRSVECEGKDVKKWRWVRMALLGAAAVGVVLCWYRDDNFHRELAMSRSIGQQDWEQVLKTAKAAKDEPTRAMCMMQNLALLHTGQLGDEMLRYPQGAKQPAAPFPMRMVQTYGKMLYLQYGVPNYCYRWCMEDGVEYGWTVERLKLMALCSLLNHEKAAAQRMLNLLKKTTFHKQWARKYEAYLHTPELMSKDRELAFIAHMMRKDNFLTADMAQMERFLVEHFSTAESNEPLLQEQILVANMQTKNVKQAWRQLYLYTEIHSGSRLPKHYQEALCLFGNLQGINVNHIPFDADVMSNYREFMATVGRFQQQGMSMERIAPLVYDRFHTTYYYDFYFNRYQYIEQ